MMSRFSSLGKTRNSMPEASEMRAVTGMPLNTSGHQSSPRTSILVTPASTAFLKKSASSWETSTV